MNKASIITSTIQHHAYPYRSCNLSLFPKGTKDNHILYGSIIVFIIQLSFFLLSVRVKWKIISEERLYLGESRGNDGLIDMLYVRMHSIKKKWKWNYHIPNWHSFSFTINFSFSDIIMSSCFINKSRRMNIPIHSYHHEFMRCLGE